MTDKQTPQQTKKPKLLDLFCGAGMGYHRAGFDVTGVDNKPQKNYPFKFIQADALEYLCEYWQEYDFIHASPPCQRYTRLNRIKKIKAITSIKYEDLLGKARAIIRFTGLPYVIENVEGSELFNPVMLCGSMFSSLLVYRHRLFESDKMILVPNHYPHRDNTPPAGKGTSDRGYISVGSGGVCNLPSDWKHGGAAYKNMAMDIDWMIQKELTESIPPAYTEFIGKQLIKYHNA